MTDEDDYDYRNYNFADFVKKNYCLIKLEIIAT